jgi:hypothetical protein
VLVDEANEVQVGVASPVDIIPPFYELKICAALAFNRYTFKGGKFMSRV